MLGQVCILFFSPSSRDPSLIRERETKDDFFNETHGNLFPTGTEIEKAFAAPMKSTPVILGDMST